MLHGVAYCCCVANESEEEQRTGEVASMNAKSLVSTYLLVLAVFQSVWQHVGRVINANCRPSGVPCNRVGSSLLPRCEYKRVRSIPLVHMISNVWVRAL